MRLFVAIEIPESLRAELDRRCRVVRGDLPKARWVRPEAMHLTLSFLGDTESELLPALHRELAAAFAREAPFELALDDVGCFPPRGKARTLWTGLAMADDASPEADTLAVLQKEVAQAVARATSIPPEKRPFHPHVTLARCKQPWSRGAVERFRRGFGELPGESFRVSEGTLFESELHPTGARYRVVRTYSTREH